LLGVPPVGLVCARAGTAFVTTIGWRLIPKADRPATVGEGGEPALFMVEARVKEDSVPVEKPLGELYPLADEHDVSVLGLVRRGKRLPGFAAGEEVRKGDLIVIEGDPKIGRASCREGVRVGGT